MAYPAIANIYSACWEGKKKQICLVYFTKDKQVRVDLKSGRIFRMRPKSPFLGLYSPESVDA